MRNMALGHYTGAHPLLALAGASALDHYTGAPPLFR